MSGLINYFGKTDLPTNEYAVPANNGEGNASIDGISIKPVLLRKGRTNLGLYGIGNVKDTRMHFELMHNRVKMFKPKNAHEYCNLLLVHQNRFVTMPKSSIPPYKSRDFNCFTELSIARMTLCPKGYSMIRLIWSFGVMNMTNASCRKTSRVRITRYPNLGRVWPPP